MLDWTYTNPVDIHFGNYSLTAPSLFVECEKTLVVTSQGSIRRGALGLLESMPTIDLVGVIGDVPSNPDLKYFDWLARNTNFQSAKSIIAIGGGSVIDAAKVIARIGKQKSSNFSLSDYFYKKIPFEELDSIPLIAVPTTAGTGSEVTPFATVWDFEKKENYLWMEKDLYPAKAILDPTLTLTLPKKDTVISALDTISHGLEAIWNVNASSITSSLASTSLSTALSTIVDLSNDLQNLDKRSKMMEASLMAGLAISQTRTALSHSISYPLTANYHLPHGVASYLCLPAILEYNAQQDDGRLSELLRRLGYSTVNDLSATLLEIFIKTGGKELLEKFISSPHKLMEHVDLMITPERSGNNMRSVSKSDLFEVINLTISKIKSC